MSEGNESDDGDDDGESELRQQVQVDANTPPLTQQQLEDDHPQGSDVPQSLVLTPDVAPLSAVIVEEAPTPSILPIGLHIQDRDENEDGRGKDGYRLRAERLWESSVWPFLKPLIPKKNYFWGHMSYYIFMSLLGGLILWALEPIWYLDGLFIAASALCVTGLSTLDISTFSSNAQVLILIWMLLGGLVTLSVVPLIIRLLFFKFRKPDKDDDFGYEIALPQTTRILKRVILTVVCYSVFIQMCCFIIMGAYLSADKLANKTMNNNGVDNPWWWSLFYTVSAFQNAGFAIFGSSVVPFSNDQLITLVLAFLIVAGNTLFPVFLRLVFIIMHKLSCNGQTKADLEELLLNPRYYYFLLFSKFNTWVLFICWLLITTVEWCIFFVEWDRVAVYGTEFSAGIKLMINFFQTVSVRTCGMNNVNIGALNYGHLSFLIFSMYLSAFPFMISVRSTDQGKFDKESGATPQVTKQAKGFLGRDLLWIYLTIVIITFIEFNNPPEDPSIIPNSFLSIVFEVVSAFGTVGLSMGYPNQNYSYCGSFNGFSKFFIILAFLAGRHRWLPESIDYAVTPYRSKHQNHSRHSIDSHLPRFSINPRLANSANRTSLESSTHSSDKSN